MSEGEIKHQKAIKVKLKEKEKEGRTKQVECERKLYEELKKKFEKNE